MATRKKQDAFPVWNICLDSEVEPQIEDDDENENEDDERRKPRSFRSPNQSCNPSFATSASFARGILKCSIQVAVQEPEFVRTLFSSIAHRYDFANHLLSGGLDFFWRQRAARIVRRWHPASILDLATGSGDLALTMRRYCPEAALVGADFCEPMLEKARAKGLSHTVVADALRLPFADETFDVVTVAFGLRNMASWDAALREMARVLRKGGHLLVLDFSIPPPPLRAAYRFYLHRCLPKIAGFLTREKGAYDYLAQSIERFPSGQQMRRLLEANGFRDAASERLTGGIVSLYTATRPKITEPERLRVPS